MIGLGMRESEVEPVRNMINRLFTGKRMRVLDVLDRNGPMTYSALKNELGLGDVTFMRYLADLQEFGLLRKVEKDAFGRRVSVYELTDRARTVLHLFRELLSVFS